MESTVQEEGAFSHTQRPYPLPLHFSQISVFPMSAFLLPVTPGVGQKADGFDRFSVDGPAAIETFDLDFSFHESLLLQDSVFVNYSQRQAKPR